ncbi:MAG: ABC transporter permease [Anaerolineaceae bacterium]|nr:ABC transporter permease [Anaerolineaceae bacterium]
MPTLTLASDTINSEVKKRSEHKSPLQLAMARFGHNRLAIFALVLMLLIIFISVAAPLLAPYDPIKRSIMIRLKGPSPAHWLGTDALGRDNLSRIIWGGRVSLWIGLASVFISLVLGVPLGLIAGYSGGRIGSLIMRVMDLIQSFPSIIFAIWLVSMIGPGVNQVIVANALFALPEFSRIVRGSVLSLQDLDYVTASKALGASKFRIMAQHILPNVLAPIIVISSLSISGAILSGASLSFLGLGAQPPTPEWGAMLSDGRPYMRSAWWLAVFPGLMLTLFVLASNIFGDGLRDVMDPRTATKK